MNVKKQIMAVVLFAMAITYAYYGGFTTVTPFIKMCGGETLVYKKVIGGYSHIAKVSDAVHSELLNEYDIETDKEFGIYYNSSKNFGMNKLPSDIGCIIENKDVEKFKTTDIRFDIGKLPEEEYMVIEFPFKGKLSGLVATMKVYPVFEAYAKQNGYVVDTPVMEIWDIVNKKTSYRKKLISQSDSQTAILIRKDSINHSLVTQK